MSRSMLKLKINFKLLEAYKKVHGNLKIPDKFIVPISNKFPKYLHGSHLGEYVSTIRWKYMKDRNYFEVDDKIKADEMGFVWNVRGIDEIISKFRTRPKGINFMMLELYLKLHGNLDVEKHFVVPSYSANWPTYMHDSHLGKYVQDLRITNVLNPAFFTIEERERLNSIGFLWKESNYFTFDTIMTALESYKALHGTLKISTYFVVPKGDPNFPASTWGMKLFGIANYVRTEAYLTEEQLKKLCEIGFSLSAPEKHEFVLKMEFNLLYKCLETYQSIHGDLLVPYKYIVPEGDAQYPSKAWGAKLGSMVFHMRDKFSGHLSDCAEKRKITSLGFVWNTQDFSTVWSALEAYKAVHQDLLVPLKFVVPLNDNHFPQNTWGLPLGKIVSDIRHKEEYSSHKKELSALGFDFRKKVHTDFDTTFSALKAYKALNEGSLLIPTDYVVPTGSIDFPESTWRLKLGNIACRIRNGSLFAKEKEKLETLGFVFSNRKQNRATNQHFEFDVVYRAFEKYKELYGHLQIPQRFVIEANDVRFPPESWGLWLGQTLREVIHSNRYATYRNELTELGINFDKLIFKVKKQNRLNVIITALQSYKNIHHHFNIPSSYIVPSDSSIFPSECWNLPLGKIVHDIQKRRYYAEYHDKLKQIGFDPAAKLVGVFAVSDLKNYNADLGQFIVVFDALKKYKEIYGNLEISKHFIVPTNDTAFPQSARDMKLGQLLHAISNNKIYSEHREKLEDLGVVYQRFTLFKNVFGALQIYKKVHGNLNIEKDYVIQEKDYDYPANYWKMELGKITREIRTKDKFIDHRQELINIDFPFAKKTVKFPVIQQALLDYKAIYGNMNVPKRFVVPLADERFKVEAHGLKLGYAAHNIRWNHAHVSKRAELEEMGFEFKDNKTMNAALLGSNCISEVRTLANRKTDLKFNKVFSALQAYKNLHHNLIVPYKFIVPHNDANYPKECWGMLLGRSVYKIRRLGSFSEYRAQLEEIGFVYKDYKPIVELD